MFSIPGFAGRRVWKPYLTGFSPGSRASEALTLLSKGTSVAVAGRLGGTSVERRGPMIPAFKIFFLGVPTVA